ncbi:uncharacterized protein LOC117324550 isoform X2 [Pecten maximus]|uniref:uncharacterized protein LOC117324550 isoform X2 n=1 Tax=Pecten maximus TaxID=6579 RepID=UPI0014580E26|nr:uncharacterized protein LOC117324550 isoform X2 [Pecten maximus]
MYRPWYIAKGNILFSLIVLLSAISGPEASLTDAIFHGQAEVLVSPGLVRKDGLTLDTCASACVSEKSIKCQFFKFINSTKTCYLSETDHPKVKHMVNGKPRVSKTGSSSRSEKSTMQSKFEDLEKSIDKLKNVQRKVENLAETDDEKSSGLKTLQKQSVKQVKAIVTLDGRLRSLHSQVLDISGDLSELQKSQRTIAKNVQSVKSSTGSLGSNVKRLAHLSGELQSDVEDVKLFNSSILRQLAKVSHSTSNLDRKLNRLSSYLHDKRIFNSDDMQQTQFRISKGMASLAHSQKTFWHQLHGLHHNVDMLTATLGRESQGRGHTHSAILNLQTSIHNIKMALAKMSDPMSVQNRRWQGDVNSIKHVLSQLAGTNSRLDGEMRGNRREVASVIKDLTNVQMAVQSLKSNIDGIRSTNADLVESVQELLKTKTKIPSILQMTKISTTILKSLSAIERKERILTSRMKQFGDSLSNMEKRMQSKYSNNRLQKHALLQLSRQVKSLSGDMQRISKLVINIHKNQPTNVGKRIEAVQRKLISTISKLQMKLTDMEVKMKRGQSAVQSSSVKAALGLFNKSTKMLKTSIKALKSDVKKLRDRDRATERKVDRLHETVMKAKKGKLKPRILCPMGKLRRGNICVPLKPSTWKKPQKGRKGRRRPGRRHKGRRRPSRRHHRRRRPGRRHHRRRRPGRRHHRKRHVRRHHRKKKPVRRHHRKRHVRRHHRKKRPVRRHHRKRHVRRHHRKKKPVRRHHRKRHVRRHHRKRHVRRHNRRKRHVRRKYGGKKHERESKEKKRPAKHRRHGKHSSHQKFFFPKERGRRETKEDDSYVKSFKRETDSNTKVQIALPEKQGPSCPSGYQLVDYYCFMYLPMPRTYDMASLQCHSHNGSVPEVTSREMQQALKVFLLETGAEVPSVWLSSMLYNSHAKKWYWENSGDPVLYENYMRDPPAGKEGEMCNQFRVEWDSHWSANSCNDHLRLPTVCHHQIDSLPPISGKLPYGL